MGKKRKQVEALHSANKDESSAPIRPPRTLTGWKDAAAAAVKNPVGEGEGDTSSFRNREKVLVTCSRRINFRYRHLMLNVVSLLPHCKKDSKVESKESKGSTLNELIELRNCSSCLFFEV